MKPSEYADYDRNFNFFKKTLFKLIAGYVHFKGEPIPCGGGPKLILCNHNTDFDFMLLGSVCDETMDIVATETVLRMGPVQRYLAIRFRLILHDKGSKGVATLKQMALRAKDGRNILLFPEGNRSFDGRTGEVSSAIGKIAKMTGTSLVVYRLTGGYLTTPRWGVGIRRGAMGGKVTAYLSSKELSDMSAKDVQKVIEEALMTDAYKEQEENRTAFKSRKKAEHLEALLSVCPSCKKSGHLISEKTSLYCSCGYRLTMDEYGYLLDEENKKQTITEAFEHQKELIKERLSGSRDNELWSDELTLTQLATDHSIVSNEQVKLSAFRDYLVINEKPLPKDQITSVDIVQRNRLIIHVNGSDVRFEFTGDKTFNAVKYRIWHGISFA